MCWDFQPLHRHIPYRSPSYYTYNTASHRKSIVHTRSPAPGASQRGPVRCLLVQASAQKTRTGLVYPSGVDTKRGHAFSRRRGCKRQSHRAGQFYPLRPFLAHASNCARRKDVLQIRPDAAALDTLCTRALIVLVV